MDAGLARTCVYCHANGHWSDHSSGLITEQIDTSLLIHLNCPPCVDIGLAIHPGWLCEWTLVWLLIWVDYCVNGLWATWSFIWVDYCVNECAEGHYKWIKLSLTENPLHTKSVFMFDLSSFKISLCRFTKFLKHWIFFKHCVLFGPGYP